MTKLNIYDILNIREHIMPLKIGFCLKRRCKMVTERISCIHGRVVTTPQHDIEIPQQIADLTTSSLATVVLNEVFCPHCGVTQAIEFQSFSGKDVHDYCVHCGEELSLHDR